jgi:hypothetical protein
MSTSQTHVIESQGTHGHVNIRRDAQDAELRTQSYAPPVSSGLNQEADRAGPSIRWSDDVVDNENMGKKKIKEMLHLPQAEGIRRLERYGQRGWLPWWMSPQQ